MTARPLPRCSLPPSAALCAHLLLACNSDRVHVPPPDTVLRTLVVARPSGAGDAWQLSVHDSEESWSSQVLTAEVVYLVGYGKSPAELGLVGAGPPACELRRPELVTQLTEGEDGWFWQEVASPPPTLLDAIVGGPTRCNPCAPITMRGLLSSQLQRYSGADWLEDGTLFAASPEFFARIHRDRIEDLPSCPGLGLVPDSMIGLGEDRFLIGGAFGELAVLRLSDQGRSCVVETSTAAPLGSLSPRVSGFDTLAANPESPGDFDFYALRANGDLYHWTTRGLRLLARLPTHPDAESADPTSILRLDARRALVSAGWNQVNHIEGETLVHSEVLPLPTSPASDSPEDRITMLHLDARSGRYFAGTKMGAIWARGTEGGSWEPVFQSPVVEAIGTIVELSDRYLITIDGGDLVAWGFEAQTCPEAQRLPMSSNGSRCRHALRRGDQIALVDAIGNSATFAGVVWIDP